MIVYVESNFVLEIALGQEEAPAAETILQFAENNKLILSAVIGKTSAISA